MEAITLKSKCNCQLKLNYRSLHSLESLIHNSRSIKHFPETKYFTDLQIPVVIILLCNRRRFMPLCKKYL